MSLVELTAGRGGEGRGKEPNDLPARKPGPLFSINCSLVQSLLYKGKLFYAVTSKLGLIEYDCQLALPDPGQLNTAARGEDLATLLPDNLLIKNTKSKKTSRKSVRRFSRFSKQKWQQQSKVVIIVLFDRTIHCSMSFCEIE